MSAKTSGAEPRDHSQGNQRRSYTVEQKTAVIRVQRCGPTAFYDILGLEEVRKTCTDSEIKKAYRKLSLLTHPDKNGYEGADEAFKMVSRAFQVLSDPDKKEKYDRFGGDPDSRFGAGGPGPASSPFAGFARTNSGRPTTSMWEEEEISPEELFRRFFGGGGGFGGGFGPFGGEFVDGPGFTFSFGGMPGFAVHQMGGERVRRRPTGGARQEEGPQLQWSLASCLPLLMIIFIPMLLSLFSLGPDSHGPEYRVDTPLRPFTLKRTMPNYGVDYYLNPKDVASYSKWRLSQFDAIVQARFANDLSNNCDLEIEQRRRLVSEAQGWFSVDQDKIQKAEELEMKSCKRCDKLGIPRHSYA